jgi:triosephosphate isomerase
MRTPVIAGNWKMNTTVAEAAELVKAMKEKLNQIGGVEKVLCPPFVSLTTVKELIRGTSIKLGAQNMYFERSGAYTGEISPAMLAALCEFVIRGTRSEGDISGKLTNWSTRRPKLRWQQGLHPSSALAKAWNRTTPARLCR